MRGISQVIWGLVVGLLIAGLLWLPEKHHMNGYAHALLFTGAVLVVGLISMWLFPKDTGLSLKQSLEQALVPALHVIALIGLCGVVAMGLFLLSFNTEGALSDYSFGAAVAIGVVGPILVASWHTYTVFRKVRLERNRKDRGPVSQ